MLDKRKDQNEGTAENQGMEHGNFSDASFDSGASQGNVTKDDLPF